MLPGFQMLLNSANDVKDYEYEYETSNRFGYWGNGFTTIDAGELGGDFSWYIDAVP